MRVIRDAFHVLAQGILPAVQFIDDVRGHVEGDHQDRPAESCWWCRRERGPKLPRARARIVGDE